MTAPKTSPRNAAIDHLRAALASGVRGDLRAELEAALATALASDEKAAGEPSDLHYRRMRPRTRLFDPTRPGFIARKGADGAIVWMYRYARISDGGQVELRFGRSPDMTLADARKVWRGFRDQRLKGNEPQLAIATDEMTVGQLMNLYLTKYVAVAQSVGTQKLANYLLEKWLRPQGGVAVSAFGATQARAVLEPLIFAGRLVTANQLKALCSTMWVVGLTGGTKRHRVGEPWLSDDIRNPWPLAVVACGGQRHLRPPRHRRDAPRGAVDYCYG